jgi:hypothetical protein
MDKRLEDPRVSLNMAMKSNQYLSQELYSAESAGSQTRAEQEMVESGNYTKEQ